MRDEALTLKIGGYAIACGGLALVAVHSRLGVWVSAAGMVLAQFAVLIAARRHRSPETDAEVTQSLFEDHSTEKLREHFFD